MTEEVLKSRQKHHAQLIDNIKEMSGVGQCEEEDKKFHLSLGVSIKSRSSTSDRLSVRQSQFVRHEVQVPSLLSQS